MFKSTDWYLILFLFSFLSLTFGGHGTFVDENLIIQVLDSLFQRGELTVDNMFQALPGPDGKFYSRYGFVFPLLMAPFYGLGYLVKWLVPEPHIYYLNPHMFAMLWGSLLITVATGWMFYRLCLDIGAAKADAALLSIVLIVGTSFWPYSQTLYRLTAATLHLLLVLYCCFRYLNQSKSIFLYGIGFLTAVGLNLREDLVIGLFLIGVYLLWNETKQKRFYGSFSMMVGALGGVALWCGHNYMRFGRFFIENYEDLSFNYPLILSIPQLMIGYRRGLITYSPVLLLFPFTLWFAYVKQKLGLWLLCFAILASYMLLYGKSSMWHGGVCWGPRHMYFLLPFALLPIVYMLKSRWAAQTRIFLWVSLGIGMMMNWPGLYAHQGRFQDFFTAPSFFELIAKPVVHPDYITFDELDLWWVRMIKMDPISIWTILFILLLISTIWSGHRLWKKIVDNP